MALTATHIKRSIQKTIHLLDFILCPLRELLISEGSNCQLETWAGVAPSLFLVICLFIRSSSSAFQAALKYMMIAWQSEGQSDATQPSDGSNDGKNGLHPQYFTLNSRNESTHLTDWESCCNACSCSKLYSFLHLLLPLLIRKRWAV